MEDSLTRVRLYANAFSWFLCFSLAKSEAPIQLSLSFSLSASTDFSDVDMQNARFAGFIIPALIFTSANALQFLCEEALQQR